MELKTGKLFDCIFFYKLRNGKLEKNFAVQQY